LFLPKKKGEFSGGGHKQGSEPVLTDPQKTQTFSRKSTQLMFTSVLTLLSPGGHYGNKKSANFPVAIIGAFAFLVFGPGHDLRGAQNLSKKS